VATFPKAPISELVLASGEGMRLPKSMKSGWEFTGGVGGGFMEEELLMLRNVPNSEFPGCEELPNSFHCPIGISNPLISFGAGAGDIAPDPGDDILDTAVVDAGPEQCIELEVFWSVWLPFCIRFGF
jgi:hypothetical protein